MYCVTTDQRPRLFEELIVFYKNRIRCMALLDIIDSTHNIINKLTSFLIGSIRHFPQCTMRALRYHITFKLSYQCCGYRVDPSWTGMLVCVLI